MMYDWEGYVEEEGKIGGPDEVIGDVGKDEVVMAAESTSACSYLL